MYRLKVISGPSAGKSFTLSQGETTIGRQSGNSIVLNSDNVSKRHCVIIYRGNDVSIKDDSSANGTFVNGILTREKKLRLGDRVSVGDFVLEFKRLGNPADRGAPRPAPRSTHSSSAPLPTNMLALGNVYQFPNPPQGGLPMAVGSSYGGGAQPAMQQVPTQGLQPVQVPTDLKEKFFWYFENYVMPFFYGLNLKQDWKSICMMVFGGFLFCNLMISVYPLIDSNRRMVMQEATRRAQFIAQQISERNSSAISSGVESRADLGTLERSEGVVAYLTDLDNRIIAPTSKVNQYLVAGGEAAYAVKAAQLFRRGRETGVTGEIDSSTVVAIEPIKAFDSKTGKNTTLAMAVVAVDASMSIPSGGGLSLIFSESFILSSLLAIISLLILYRLTLKPFEVLNEDIDRVLKGDTQQITHEFKSEELDPLWDVIRAAIQRLPRGSSQGDEMNMPVGILAQDLEPMAQAVGESTGKAVVLCDSDRQIVFLNEAFEEASGIRASDAIGRDFSGQARDQAFSALIKDLFERVQLSGSQEEDFEFNGAAYKISVSSVGTPQPKAFLFIFGKAGD